MYETTGAQLRDLDRQARRAWLRLQAARLANWLRPVDEPPLPRAVRAAGFTALCSAMFFIGLWYGPVILSMWGAR